MRPLAAPIAVVFLAALTSSCGTGAGVPTSPDVSLSPLACPPRLLAEGSLRSENRIPGASREIVPGRPDWLLLCRYREPNQGRRAPHLSSRRYLDMRPTGESIADRLNRLPPAQGAYACPADSGGVIYAIFRYESEATLIVEVSPGGCPAVRNGRAHARVLSPRLATWLKHLVPLPTQHVATPSGIRGARGAQGSESVISPG